MEQEQATVKELQEQLAQATLVRDEATQHLADVRKNKDIDASIRDAAASTFEARATGATTTIAALQDSIETAEVRESIAATLDEARDMALELIVTALAGFPVAKRPSRVNIVMALGDSPSATAVATYGVGPGARAINGTSTRAVKVDGQVYGSLAAAYRTLRPGVAGANSASILQWLAANGHTVGA